MSDYAPYEDIYDKAMEVRELAFECEDRALGSDLLNISQDIRFALVLAGEHPGLNRDETPEDFIERVESFADDMPNTEVERTYLDDDTASNATVLTRVPRVVTKAHDEFEDAYFNGTDDEGRYSVFIEGPDR